MSESSPTLDELREKELKIFNLIADTLLKDLQRRTEIWKVVIAAAAGGAAFLGATLALFRYLTP